MPGDRCRPDVVPVLVVGGQLLGLARLDVVHVGGQLGLRVTTGGGEGGRGGGGGGGEGKRSGRNML